jgi:hypothetical protein
MTRVYIKPHISNSLKRSWNLNKSPSKHHACRCFCKRYGHCKGVCDLDQTFSMRQPIFVPTGNRCTFLMETSLFATCMNAPTPFFHRVDAAHQIFSHFGEWSNFIDWLNKVKAQYLLPFINDQTISSLQGV